MRLAFVVPRYGAEVVGGAERAARGLAEHLVRLAGFSVEVLTTCALDAGSWANHYPAGETEEGGVRVRRFASATGRHPGFSAYAARVLFAPSVATPEEAAHFVDLQGPCSPDLLDALASVEADVVVFTPYLYHPTVRGVPLAKGHAVLHPAAHDEPALYLPVYDEVFRGVSGLVYHTASERRLVERRFQVAERHSVVLGLGIDGRPEGLARRPGGELVGLGDRPYLCCVGRVDDLKGTSLLAELFAAYKARRPGPLALVLVGPVAVRPIEHDDIVLTGPVDEADKWDLVSGALALVSPSPYESFSVVMMEAFSESVPVLVNARCEATREHCVRSGGGLWFGSYAEFEVLVDRLLVDERLRERLGRNGRAYVQASFTWQAVTERYVRFVRSLR